MLRWKCFLGILLFNAVALAEVITFNESGDFEAPSGVTSVTVYVWGAGGGAAFNNTAGRPGGGGGAFAARMNVPVTPGSSYDVIVGTGGAVGLNAGAKGGTSSFVGDAGVNVVAEGGFGATLTNPGMGGRAAFSVGDLGLIFSGGNGGNGFVNAGGGGGAAAGTQADGQNGIAGLGVTGGLGGIGR